METAQQLVGRQVLRNFGKHGAHKGTITSFDEDGKLTFRVEYEDGDCEDLVEADVRYTLSSSGWVQCILVDTGLRGEQASHCFSHA